MRENWRETLPDPATIPVTRDELQKQRAALQADRMRRALADLGDEKPKRRAKAQHSRGSERRSKASKVAMWVLVAILVFVAAFAALRAAADAQTDVATVDAPMDGSTAGANAVTVEDLKAREDYETDWQKVNGYTVMWDVRSEGDGVTIASASDGPVYDLPIGWTSFTAHDRANNRAYTVIVNDVGAFEVFPTLDADGNQVITERY